MASAKEEKKDCKCNPLVWCLCCLCIPCMLAYKIIEWVLKMLVRSATLTADTISGSAGKSSTLAFSEGIKVPNSVWNGNAVTIKVPMYHKDDYGQYNGALCFMTKRKSRQVDLLVKLKFVGFNKSKSYRRICSPVCRPSSNAVQLPITRNNDTLMKNFQGTMLWREKDCNSHYNSSRIIMTKTNTFRVLIQRWTHLQSNEFTQFME